MGPNGLVGLVQPDHRLRERDLNTGLIELPQDRLVKVRADLELVLDVVDQEEYLEQQVRVLEIAEMYHGLVVRGVEHVRVLRRFLEQDPLDLMHFHFFLN
jgi:uncharacterized protein (UPF0216 family)